jgi:hypothetical protein
MTIKIHDLHAAKTLDEQEARLVVGGFGSYRSLGFTSIISTGISGLGEIKGDSEGDGHKDWINIH